MFVNDQISATNQKMPVNKPMMLHAAMAAN
ncbi:hypothetical protein VP217E381_P0054 [Vibrio phage 217E38-1]|nr:hypothetical protein VP217E381_P0054 [Vibrio phage 217E38-1]